MSELKKLVEELSKSWIPCHYYSQMFSRINEIRQAGGLTSDDIFSEHPEEFFMTFDGRRVMGIEEDGNGFLCLVQDENKDIPKRVVFPKNGILSKPHIYHNDDIIGIWKKEDSEYLNSLCRSMEEKEERRVNAFNEGIRNDILRRGESAVIRDIMGYSDNPF